MIKEELKRRKDLEKGGASAARILQLEDLSSEQTINSEARRANIWQTLLHYTQTPMIREARRAKINIPKHFARTSGKQSTPWKNQIAKHDVPRTSTNDTGAIK